MRNSFSPVCTKIAFLTLAVLTASWMGCDSAVIGDSNAETMNAREGQAPSALHQIAAEWDYSDGELGPAHWAELFADCGGVSQSPIDIQTSDFKRNFFNQLRSTTFGRDHGSGFPFDVTSAAPMRFDYVAENETEAFNNGHTVEVEIHDPTWTLEVGGVTYTALQFHFHTQSEHTVNGKFYPIEMHIVHKNEETGNLAVVGVFIEAGEENEELGEIWADLPGVGDARRVEIHDLDLFSVLPKNRSNYRYSGSLTTPGCFEIVSWHVLRTPIQMSQAQIDAFIAVFSDPTEFPNGNRRPVQPLNGRRVSQHSF